MQPAPVDFNFADTGALGNAILDKLNRMREADPVFWSDINHCWIVNGHAQVVEGFAGRKPLSAVRLPHLLIGAIAEEDRPKKIPYLLETVPHWVVNMDRPAQWRLRNLAQKAFGSDLAESLRPTVRGFIDEAFADVAGLDRYDFVDKVARRVPGRTILKLLGLPDSIYPRLHHWSVVLNASLGGVNLPEEVIVQGEQTLLEMREMFLPEIEARRRHPTDDFISLLVTAREADGDRLSEEELLGLLYVALIAGHDTTANTIALGTAALAELPEVRQHIRDHPEQLPEIVLELMRYIAMSTMIPRIALEDFDWCGHRVRQGDMILLMIAGANRDPAVFSDPETLDVHRRSQGNMTFGPGVHFCIGHYLAKMQVQEFIAALVDRYDPELRDDRLNFGLSLTFRGVESLDIRLHPAA